MRKRSPRITVHCHWCGKEMQVTEARLNAGRGRYCSRACAARSTHTGRKKPPRTKEFREKQRRSHLGQNPWNKKPRITKHCEICHKDFTVEYRRRDSAKYCSRACSHEAKRRVTGTDHPLWTRVQKTCEWCGKKKWVKPAKLDEFRFCSRQCQGSYTSYQASLQNGPTSIERALIDEMSRRDIIFEFQYRIAVWSVDFAFPYARLVVEADGDYWHSTKDQQKKDANKDHWLNAHKWHVIRLTETEINQSAAECVERIEHFLSHI